MAIFNEIIQPLKSVMLKDIIADILREEIESQCNLALEKGLSKQWVQQNIYFDVYSNRLETVDAGEMPCVMIFTPKITYDEATQTIAHTEAEINLCVEMYCAATSGECEQGGKIPADANAYSRLNYMFSQVFSVLMSQKAESTRTKNLISSMILKEYVMFKPKQTGAEFMTGGRLLFKAGVTEKFKTLSGNDWKELYVGLSVRDELITTIIKNIENNGG